MLDFRHHDALGEQVTEPLRNNLSVVKQSGRCLWVASDETDTIERLTTRDWRTFGGHTTYKLTDFFDLPVEGEVDIEGLSVDGDYLWICGSHSLKRKKPNPDEHGVEEALERLTKVECEPNRYLLGRIPLVRDGEDGIYTLCRSAPAKGRDGKTLTAGRLKMDADGANALSKALRTDEHLSRFMAIPSKDNGFDIEGISARGERVFLGMRGPVLRGWAVILELEVTEKGGNAKSAGLKLRRIGPDGERYRKHFLDLDGLGHPGVVAGRRRSADPGRADHGPGRPGRAVPLAGRLEPAGGNRHSARPAGAGDGYPIRHRHRPCRGRHPVRPAGRAVRRAGGLR